jgi:hypothetical protein
MTPAKDASITASAKRRGTEKSSVRNKIKPDALVRPGGNIRIVALSALFPVGAIGAKSVGVAIRAGNSILIFGAPGVVGNILV